MRTDIKILTHGLLPIAALAMLFPAAFASCTEEEREYDKFANTRKNNDEEDNPTDKPDTNEIVFVYDGVEPRLFEVIDLEAKGLEIAADYYGTGAANTAMEEILTWYRTRTSVVVPTVDLADKTLTSAAKQIADQALQNRFVTTTFNEGAGVGGLTTYYDMSGSNGTPDWDKIPAGVSDDKEFNKQIHRLQCMPYLAKAYYCTGEDKYVEKLISLYDDYMAKYPVPSGRTWDTPYTGLQLSGKLIGWVEVFPYIIGSDKVTAAWLSKIMVYWNDVMECNRNNWYSPTTSNIYFAQVQAENEFAMTFPEYKNGEYWLYEGANLVTSQLTTQFNADGVQNELDLSYHIGVVSNFETIQKFVIANGKEAMYPEDYSSYLKNSCRFVMDMLYPNYSTENFNDTRSARQTKSVLLRNLQSYSEMFPEDKELLWMASEGKQGEKPTSRLQKYSTSGYYMLRNEWGADGTMLILKNNYNPDNKWHCQPDNGTIALWKGGRRFLPDAGVFTYDTGKDSKRSEYAATEVHNTMTLGLATIANDYMKGKYLGDGSADNYIWIATENQSYSNLTHRRAVFMVDSKFFVIVDEGYGSASGTVNLHFNLCADSGSNGKNVVQMDIDANKIIYGVHTMFPDNNNMLFRSFSETADGYKSIIDTTPVSDEIDKSYDRFRYNVSVSKTSSNAARMITVIYPFGAPAESDGISVSAAFTDNEKGKEGTFHENGAAVKVTVNGTEYNLAYTL